MATVASLADVGADVVVVANTEDSLGECPLWDDREQRLIWTNINGKVLHTISVAPDGALSAPTTTELPEKAGSFALRESSPGLLLALETGFYLTHALGGDLTPVPSVYDSERVDGVRLNDGRVDRSGRFVCGAIHNTEPAAYVYQLAADLTSRRLLPDAVQISNSICFSPAGDVLYFADSPTHDILAFPYASDAAPPSAPRVFATVGSGPGLPVPDGSCIDEEGCLWNAQYGGGKVVRYRPDGTVDREIACPATQLTCCGFGGPDLDVLFITSARQNLDESAVEANPLHGAVFAVRPGVRGLPEDRFRG